jgi:hypothetical protein
MNIIIKKEKLIRINLRRENSKYHFLILASRRQVEVRHRVGIEWVHKKQGEN